MHRIVCAAFFATVFVLSASAQAGLLMYYDFNSEASGMVPDLSGNGQTGNLNGVGSTTLTADGDGYTGLAGDKALSYSSTPASVNYFVATSTVSPGTDDFSVSFWYKTAQTQTHALVDHSQIPDNTAGYQIFTNANGGQVAIWDDDPQNHLATGTGLFTLGDSEWHHVVVSVDRGAATGKVYVDASEVDTFSTSDLHDVTLGELHIGTFNNGQVRTTGLIDDYAIFDSALSQSQVTDLTNGAPVIGNRCSPGDTDGDGDIDTGDLTTSIQNFTGANGSTTKTCEEGDTNGDGDVDTGDLTFSIQNFTGAQAANAGVPDLIYDPNTGNVTIDADGADVISFSLQAGPFNAADFSALPAGLTDNIANQIGWTSFNLFTGLTGSADLGNILPAGLDLAGLEAALGVASYGLALSGGGGGGRLDLIIPEPASMVVMGFGALAVLRRRAA